MAEKAPSYNDFLGMMDEAGMNPLAPPPDLMEQYIKAKAAGLAVFFYKGDQWVADPFIETTARELGSLPEISERAAGVGGSTDAAKGQA